MFRSLLNKLDSITESTNSVLLGFIDEFADGDVWLIKAPPEIAKTFIMLANTIEDETVKGTEYDPETGHMGQIHAKLGDASVPKWAQVTGQLPPEVQEELQGIRPISAKVINKLKTVDGNMEEFMSEFLWDLESAGRALVVSNEANYVGNTINFQGGQSIN